MSDDYEYAPSPDECCICHTKIEPGASGRVSKWLVMKAGREGWFFQRDGTAYCPEHVPDWVEGWRVRQSHGG